MSATKRYQCSAAAFERARTVIAGGVNSPVRAFTSVGGTPVFMRSASGSRVTDVDGNCYIDYVGSWGPAVLGHNHPAVIAAIHDAVDRGISFGTPTEIESAIAEKVLSMVPSMEKVRFVNSGTEATMSALRLARAYTGREKIIKFTGGYHGHTDSLLVEAGSGALTLGKPSSPGVPAHLAELTLALEYNNPESLRQTFARVGDTIAAVIVEPVAGNMNCIPASRAFIQCLRDVCSEYDSVLIFDEVMTGFRVSPGGAQQHYGVAPDITCLGKIVGGGMPVGALGGREDIMDMLAPDGPVYQAGTLSGNPVAMAAGLRTLDIISTAGFHQSLSAKTERLCNGIWEQADAAGIALSFNRAGGMFGLFIGTTTPVNRCDQITDTVRQHYRAFFHAMLDSGFYFAPSACEAAFMSAAHSTEDIEQTILAAGRCFNTMQATIEEEF